VRPGKPMRGAIQQINNKNLEKKVLKERIE
jgi:hypothetical protein